MYKHHTSGPELFSLKVKTWSKFKTHINIMVALLTVLNIEFGFTYLLSKQACYTPITIFQTLIIRRFSFVYLRFKPLSTLIPTMSQITRLWYLLHTCNLGRLKCV